MVISHWLCKMSRACFWINEQQTLQCFCKDQLWYGILNSKARMALVVWWVSTLEQQLALYPISGIFVGKTVWPLAAILFSTEVVAANTESRKAFWP